MARALTYEAARADLDILRADILELERIAENLEQILDFHDAVDDPGRARAVRSVRALRASLERRLSLAERAP